LSPVEAWGLPVSQKNSARSQIEAGCLAETIIVYSWTNNPRRFFHPTKHINTLTINVTICQYSLIHVHNQFILSIGVHHYSLIALWVPMSSLSAFIVLQIIIYIVIDTHIHVHMYVHFPCMFPDTALTLDNPRC
jgi:hypothetical protein